MEIWIGNEQAQVVVTEGQGALVRQVIATVIQREAKELGNNLAVSVSLVDDAVMRELNREHRGLDHATDVLSFAQLEGEELAPLPQEQPLPLGDIVLSLERCAAQAEEYGHSFERELGFLVAHGMLHLLGYDHPTPNEEAIMMAKTEEILAEVGLTRA